jgi:hypothetical protein
MNICTKNVDSSGKGPMSGSCERSDEPLGFAATELVG